ncbi:hypothetical protein BBW65_01470 [Helicobacter enhydrae]|uniref:Uncharacterized protein n=1 Tax=Helicobacter enhydrae TaxID=222136 RepID=A0A1B1U471_9HELI|nr:DUF2603 domain-containing protein [Helicobacter enhydrae]ANV97556.1 hypothetical protein BBW65_01470 [Helicobacter enhydrae]
MFDFKEQIIDGELQHINGQELRICLNQEFDSKSPCVLSAHNDTEYVLISSTLLKNLLERMRTLQEEVFEMSLERDIVNEMPLDFEDVMSVARAKIEEKHQKLLPTDCDALVKEIKKEYPNLFYNIDKYLRK